MTVPSPLPVRLLLHEKALQPLGLEVIAGEAGLDDRVVTNPRIQKPGLALAGYLPYVKPGRLQILGESEFAFLATLAEQDADTRLTQLVQMDVPALVTTKGNRPRPRVVECCERENVPLLCTEANTSEVIESVSAYLEDALAPRVQRHGVLVDVFSMGTLIIGDAGIGKSECALELVYRGHRLVADDIVVIRRTHNRGLLGTAHELLHNYLELRGVGIIDVRKHFGMTATSPTVVVSLVIELTKLSPETLERERAWRESLLDRPRAWTSTELILGVEVPKYTMAVAPGRDVAIMVETAVRKCLLAERGIQDERTFLEAINRRAMGDAEPSAESDG